MKIQYWSDLHLEFTDNAKYLMQTRIEVVGDILILAGDISYWNDRYFAHPYFDKLSEKFKKVFMIPGNHEFYNGADLSILEDPIKIKVRDNIYLLNNITESIEGIDFFFTTLWSKIKSQNAFFIESMVSDFHFIKYNRNPLTSRDFNHFHTQSYQFLSDAISNSKSKKKVVVSHHCPTEKANAKEFFGSELNDAFVIELYDFIYRSPIDYWIFGHTHRNEPPLDINGTKVLTNQLGYVHLKEHKTFKMDAHFQI